MIEYLSTNDAAKILGKASATVLYYAKIGKLKPKRTKGGIRLFSREQVESLADAMQKSKAGQ
jgi:DNA-binding transcriptional MerR regulator